MLLIQGDCLKNMRKVKCVIADPPDNIGLRYGEYNDKLEIGMYYEWMSRVIKAGIEHSQLFWLSYHSKHDLEITRMVGFFAGKRTVRKIIWRFTFGQYRESDLAYGYRPILRIGDGWVTDKIREESVRMMVGDKRAAGLRVPDDVWDYPRVVGNSFERVKWHPTQHPVKLYQRMIGMSVAAPTDYVLDMFAGSGTCFRTGYQNTIGIEIDSGYCEKLISTHFSAPSMIR